MVFSCKKKVGEILSDDSVGVLSKKLIIEKENTKVVL